MQNLSLLLSPNQAVKNTKLDAQLAGQEEGAEAAIPFADLLKGEVLQDKGLIEILPQEGKGLLDGELNHEDTTIGAIASLFQTAPTKLENAKDIMAAKLDGLGERNKGKQADLAQEADTDALLADEADGKVTVASVLAKKTDGTVANLTGIRTELNGDANTGKAAGNDTDLKGIALGEIKGDKSTVLTKKSRGLLNDGLGVGKAKAVAAANLKASSQQVAATKQASIAVAASAAEGKAEGFAHTLASSVEAASTVASQSMTGVQKMAPEVLTSNHINTPFSSPNWKQAVQQKVVWMVGAADKSATLTLNPPELGPLKVVVQVDNQSVDTTFISDNPEVRQALQDGMIQLKDKMLETGIQLGQANVSTNAQSEQAFKQALKQSQDGNGANQSGHADGDEADVTTTQTNTTTQTTGNGLVDTFA